MRKMNKKGFTIVELVIVIAVIAILSAVLIPTFSGVVANAKNTAAKADAKAAYQAYLYATAETSSETDETLKFVYVYGTESDVKYVVIENGVVAKDFAATKPTYDTNGDAVNENTTKGVIVKVIPAEGEGAATYETIANLFVITDGE